MPLNAVFQPVAERKFPSFLLWLLPAWPAAVFLNYASQITIAFPFIGVVFDAGRFPEVPWGQMASSWGLSLWIILLSFLLFAVTLGWGRRLRVVIGIRAEDGWVRLGLDTGLGILLLDLFWLGSGLVGLWYRPVLAGAAAFFLFIPLRDAAKALRPRPHGRYSAPPFPAFPFLSLLFCGAFYWVFSLAHGLVPESFYDSMLYHLAVPSNWLLQHGLKDAPSNFTANFPYGGELYFLNGFYWQGTETAKALHVLVYGAAALLAGGWARELSGEKAGWITLGMALTMPLFALNIWTTQVEGVLALALISFFYSLHRLLREGKPSLPWFFLTGLFTGLAFSVKYTALFGVAAGLLAGLFHGRGLRGITPRFYGVLFLAALLAPGAWILKNILWTGNPVFPYFPSWFPGHDLPAAGFENLLAGQKDTAAEDALSLFTLPWRMVMAPPDNYNFVGPLALALAPFLLLFRFKDVSLKFLGFSVAAYFLLGLTVTRTFRFMSPAFLLFFILAGAVFAGSRRAFWGKAAAGLGAAAAVICFFNLAAISSSYYLCAGVWSGRETREAFLTRDKTTPYLPMARWISANLPKEARLLIVGDARGLYYDRPVITGSIYDEPLLARFAREEKDAAGIVRRLQQLGVDHLAVNGEEGLRMAWDGHPYELTEPEWGRLDDLFRERLEPVYFEDFRAVYRVRGEGESGRKVFVENLVPFFSAPAARFVRSFQARQWEAAERALGEALKLYPSSPFWWERKGLLEDRMGKAAQALGSFEKAASLGRLNEGSYRRWMELANSLGKKGAISQIQKESKKWNP